MAFIVVGKSLVETRKHAVLIEVTVDDMRLLSGQHFELAGALDGLDGDAGLIEARQPLVAMILVDDIFADSSAGAIGNHLGRC